jgi:hypothetical protein
LEGFEDLKDPAGLPRSFEDFKDFEDFRDFRDLGLGSSTATPARGP